MVSTLLTLSAASLTAAGLWSRRITWRFRWESAATLNLAGTLACLLCWLPTIGPLRHALYAVTHTWNLEYLIGHLAYTVGITALASNMAARIDMPNRDVFLRKHFEIPITASLPTISAAFIKGVPSERVTLLISAPATGWLACYWILACTIWLWMLGHLLWALLVIHQDSRSRTIADIYITATSVDITSAAIWLLSVVTDAPTAEPAVTLACVASIIYAIAAITGMRRLRQRWKLLEGNHVEQ